MKATEQYFPVVLFIMLYKVVLTFESVDEILKCDHSNKSYWAVLSRGAVYLAVQGFSNFSLWMKSSTVAIMFKSNESYRAVLSFGACYTLTSCLANHNGDWVPGISTGLHCGQLAPRWTTPLLVNPHNPTMSPTRPCTRHTDLVSGKKIKKQKQKEGGREGWGRRNMQNPAKIPRRYEQLTARRLQ